MNHTSQRATVSVSALIALLTVCGPAARGEHLLDTTFDPGDFDSMSAEITNPYWPLMPGTQYFFAESTDGCEVEEFTVTNDTKADFANEYQGIAAQEIRDRAWLDEECTGDYALVESTVDWYAQDTSGNVWYFGEDTESYDSEEGCPSAAGSWRAGSDGAEAGIVMLARPQPGVAYRQEYSPGNAEDMARVQRLNASVSIGLGSYADCLVTKEWSPLERGAVEHKFYCPIGGGLLLIKELKGKTVRVESVGSVRPDGDYADTGVCP